MGILSKIMGVFSMLLKIRAKQEFNITPITSGEMDRWVQECANIYQGNPCWLSEDDHIETVNFANTVCAETARLAMLGTKITIDGSARADWLMQRVNKIYFRLREWVEYGCAYGTVILKANGETVDLYTPGEYEVTHQTDGVIDGVVFHNKENRGDKWYTRLEYNRFEGETYIITNKCFVGESENDDKKPTSIDLTPWAGMLEEVGVENLEKPLFAVLKTPHANNIDISSPLGLPIFSEAVQELRDLDTAYSRNSKEIYDSKRMVMLDADRLLPGPERMRQKNALGRVELPDYIKLVDGDTSTESDVYHEINPTLNTDTRLTGITALLGQIGFKVGFSNGYFVFNEKTGMVTATQVESDDRRTIQFIKDVRDKLESCLGDLVYALNAFADLYSYAPGGSYEITFDFGDITYNREEDRVRWWGYVQAGRVPAWMYFNKFEGMSEEDAKAMVAEAEPKTPKLFGGE